MSGSDFVLSDPKTKKVLHGSLYNELVVLLTLFEHQISKDLHEYQREKMSKWIDKLCYNIAITILVNDKMEKQRRKN